MVGIVDRYVTRGIALRFLAVLGIVVAMLSLENVARLSADVERSNAPLLLLARLTAALIPEHLSAAIPIALMLAVALVVRQMALRGEWQILAAAGMSRTRRMAAPMAFAVLAAGLLLCDRLEWRPAGERALDDTYLALRAGDFGVPLPIGEAVSIDPATTVFVSESDGEGHLQGVIVKRDDQVYSAPLATIGHGAGGVLLTLSNGVSVARLKDGSTERAAFSTIQLHGAPPMIDMVGDDFRHRLDRSSTMGLARLARTSDVATAQAAVTALVMRFDAALFCLVIPWIATIVGVPARRRQGAAGLAVSVLLVAAHLKSAAFVEDNFAGYIVFAEFSHLAFWASVAAGLTGIERRYGEGFLDVVAAHVARLASATARRRQPTIRLSGPRSPLDTAFRSPSRI